MSDPEDRMCDACRFTFDEDDRVSEFSGATGGPESVMLCSLCSGSWSGNSIIYPRQYQESAEILQTICHVGNAVLQALEKIGKTK